MTLAEDAYQAQRLGDVARAQELFALAFEQERTAAREMENDPHLEPTRSILLRSAATLGLQAGEIREAERLVATALAGDPPDEIADELRDLLEEIYGRLRRKVR